MEDVESARVRRIEAVGRRRVRAEKVETAMIVALAGLVLFKGAPVVVGIALGLGEMMMALTRL